MWHFSTTHCEDGGVRGKRSRGGHTSIKQKIEGDRETGTDRDCERHIFFFLVQSTVSVRTHI